MRWKNLDELAFPSLSDSMSPVVFGGTNIVLGASGVAYAGFPPDANAGGLSEIPLEKEYFLKIIDLCNEKNIDVLLYKSPQRTWTAGYSNTLKNIANKYDLPLIEFNEEDMMQQIDMQFDLDSVDNSHLNFRGASKVTSYIAEYLDKNYQLPDRRNDPEYAYLAADFESYTHHKQNALLAMETDVGKYIEMLDNPDYTVLISVKDGTIKNPTDDIAEKLSSLGIESELVNQNSFVAVCEGGIAKYEASSNVRLYYQGNFADGKPFFIESAGLDCGNRSSIRLIKTEHSSNARGLNIVVYDNSIGDVIDSVCFDTATDDIKSLRN
jgi:hypothetical protein